MQGRHWIVALVWLAACRDGDTVPVSPALGAPARDAGRASDAAAHAAEVRATGVGDAATAADPAGLAAFEAALRDIGLTRDLGDGEPAIRTSSCRGETMRVTARGRVVTVRFGGCLRCELEPASPAAAAAVDPRRLGEFARALGETPPALLRLAGVTRAAVCFRLVPEPRDGGPPSEDYEGKLIGGTVDHNRHEILLSLEPMDLAGEEIVHHELYHLLDTLTDVERTVRDPEWTALNTHAYGHSDDTEPGYLNPHARDSLREDHATVYQFAMARPAELCAADAIVLAKARLLRGRIAAALGDAAFLERRAPCLAAPAK